MSSVPVATLRDTQHLTAPRLTLHVGAVVVADDFIEVVYGSCGVEFIDVTINPLLSVQLGQHAVDNFPETSRRDALVSAAYTDVAQKL